MAYQTYGSSKKSEPLQSIGLNFFQRNGSYYFILMDHFSGLPMFQKMSRTIAEEVIFQLKN